MTAGKRTPLPDFGILETVGGLLGREFAARDLRLQALETRAPGPGPQGIPGPQGDPGEPGDTGAPGRDGVGIDAPKWTSGVYRENSLVQHHIGQFFRALRDTAAEPPHADWERCGSAGFRLVGGFQEGRAYLDGDLFVREFGLFLWHSGEAHLWAGRGGKGDPGPRGLPGKDGVGRDGQDGAHGARIDHVELRGTTLVVLQRERDETLSETVVDFMPFLEATLFAVQDRFEQRLAAVEQRFDERLVVMQAELEALPKPRNGYRPTGPL
jgi:hypothetical protein